MATDLEIARSIQMKPITRIAQDAGILEDELELYGKFKAKIDLSILDRLKDRPNGKYVDVTAINPTPLGEGKTVTTIGASLGLHHIGKKVITTLRQPSLGPTFGIKGGAAGGGYSQVLPMEDLNLHLTGDFHAISLAHNLGAAFIDNHIHQGNDLNIDVSEILWRRVLDINDRALRNIIIGLGDKTDGVPRQTGFDIVVASEIMAILALASDEKDFRLRLEKMVMAFDKDKKPLTAKDLQVSGAMSVLLKDVIKPTLLQTTEHTPVLIHAGPFANIAHGNSSIIADKIALKLADYVVTESGFGAECGMEKFFNIKCRYSGLIPDCVVLVCTTRALKVHSGKFKIKPGKPLPEDLTRENVAAIAEGICNLEKQIENVRLFGVPVVVAINRFTGDSDKEIALIYKKAIVAGADDCCVSEVWAKGGAGGADLARAVDKACSKGHDFRFLYDLDLPLKKKIETIATKVYGASGVEYSDLADKELKQYTKLGYDKLPICMAKTPLSLSHDPSVKGRPTGFVLPVVDVRASVGAGFVYPLCGDINTMPGLPKEPAGNYVGFDEDGLIVGLF